MEIIIFITAKEKECPATVEGLGRGRIRGKRKYDNTASGTYADWNELISGYAVCETDKLYMYLDDGKNTGKKKLICSCFVADLEN